MTADRRPVRIARIVVSIDDSPARPTHWRVAVRLAAALRAELLGVCIEDLNLLRSVELPLARELSLVSAQARPIDAHAIEEQLRVRASRAQRTFEAAVRKVGASGSFRVLRSPISVRPRAAPSQQWAEPICVVLERPARVAELVGAALAVAGMEDRPLYFICLAADERTARELERIAGELLNHRRPTATFRWVPVSDMHTLGAAVSGRGVVIAEADGALATDDAELAELLSQISGPLLLVR